MNKLLMIMLFLLPFITYGQARSAKEKVYERLHYPDNSLEEACLKQYCDSFRSEGWKLGLSNYQVDATLEEIFTDCFPDVKIYLAVAVRGDALGNIFETYIPRVYAINTKTGKLKKFKYAVKNFNSFLHSAKREVCNLDKAYLCLYLLMHVDQGKEITNPEKYSGLRENSSIDSLGDILVWKQYGDNPFTLSPNQQQYDTMTADVTLSNNNSIYIFAFRTRNSVVYRYHFTFDKNNDIIGATVDII